MRVIMRVPRRSPHPDAHNMWTFRFNVPALTTTTRGNALVIIQQAYVRIRPRPTCILRETWCDGADHADEEPWGPTATLTTTHSSRGIR